MDHRVEDGKIPAQVKKLMREEKARGFESEEAHVDNWEFLRVSYVEMLDKYLYDLNISNIGGLNLRQKMRKFHCEALFILNHWANIHKISLVVNQDEEKKLLWQSSVDVDCAASKRRYIRNEYRENYELAGERLYDDSLYGVLLRTLDSI